MRFTLSALLTLVFAAVAMAVAPKLHDVVVSFPNNTPDHIVDEAKAMVRAKEKEGAQITHEYSKCPRCETCRCDAEDEDSECGLMRT